MPQIAQILVSTFKIFQGGEEGGEEGVGRRVGSMPPGPARNFLFFSLAIPGSESY